MYFRKVRHNVAVVHRHIQLRGAPGPNKARFAGMMADARFRFETRSTERKHQLSTEPYRQHRMIQPWRRVHATLHHAKILVLEQQVENWLTNRDRVFVGYRTYLFIQG